jgi:hypothetical protein
VVLAVGGNTARQVANAHTVFNLVNALLFVPFTTQFAALFTRMLPDRPEVEEVAIQAKYLDRELLRTPSLALDRARLEMLRMANRIHVMLDAILPAVLDGRRSDLSDARALAFEALEVVGDDAVEVGRGLTDDPLLRPWAIGWLVARGDEQPDTFTAADATAGFVQTLAVALGSGGPDAVTEMLAHDTPVHEQTATIEQLWRVDDPYTAPVLEALAETADRKVAKAARKALFKHRSAAPNRAG